LHHLWNEVHLPVKILALCFIASPAAWGANAILQTFTSPDGVFRLQYSPMLVQTTRLGDGGDVCGDNLSPATTISCFAYPNGRLKDKPTFEAAAVFVAEVNEPERACLEGSRDWNADRFKRRRSTECSLGRTGKTLRAG
jgi:hypothetical protein